MPDMILDQFDRVDATFTPRRTDDLTPGADQVIGWRGLWEAMWIIEEGPYAEEWTMCPLDLRPREFAWVPSGDLTIHGRVP